MAALKWRIFGAPWVGEVSLSENELIEYKVEGVSVLVKLKLAQEAEHKNGQTWAADVLAASDSETEEKIAGKRQNILFVSGVKKMPPEIDNILQVTEFRKLTVATLSRATWLGDRMGALASQLKADRARGSLAGSVIGEASPRPEKLREEKAKPKASAGLAKLLQGTSNEISDPFKRRKTQQSTTVKLLAALRGAKSDVDDDDDDREEEEDESEDELPTRPGKLALPEEIHEKQPGKLYREWLMDVNKLELKKRGVEPCVFSHVVNKMKNMEDSNLRGFRELQTLGMAVDHLTEFMALLVESGHFNAEEVAKFRPLQRTADVLCQRFKVVESAERQIKASKKGEDKAKIWDTLQHLELIPAASQGTMRTREMRAGVNAENARTKVLFGQK